MPENHKWYVIKVEAIISLLPSTESGRKTGITSGYRPNHNFGGTENEKMRMGQITVLNDEWIEPGESNSVEISFLMPEDYIIDLKPGHSWLIQEGKRIVGKGKITKLISSDLQL